MLQVEEHTECRHKSEELRLARRSPRSTNNRCMSIMQSRSHMSPNTPVCLAHYLHYLPVPNIDGPCSLDRSPRSYHAHAANLHLPTMNTGPSKIS